jgi:hypothetical protein
MNLKDINDKLVLVYEKSSGKPLGSGFIINEFGHFITCYHVVKDYASIKDDIRCEWKEGSYRIRYIQSLADNGFYQALKESKFTIDLIILELIIPNKNFEVEHLPTLPFDMNTQLPKSFEVSFKGFNCEKYNKREEAELSNVTTTLNNYKIENGLWLFTSESEIWRGYSGSPVLHPQLGEVMGVVVSRSPDNRQIGAIQSLHMLRNELKSYDDNYERFFRSPFSLYGEYHKGKCRSFEEDEWPYAIDKKEFVDAFDFKINRFSLKKEHGKDESNECIIPFVVEQLKEHPVFCVGYYGMGKTTISKFLFTDYSSYSTDEHPVFISFRDAELPQMSSDHWNDYVARIICQDFKKYVEVEPDSIVKDELLLQYFKHFVNHNKVALIFDGIDEVPCDRTTLGKFAKWLKSLTCTYFLTSRAEFYAFFDVFGKHMKNQSNLIVELMPWRERQWRKYTENLIRKYPEKSEGIKTLRKALDNHVYETLPERPLFLKMISDQELDNKTELEEIPVDLKANRAAIYNRYIRWKIIDDWKWKRGIDCVEEIDFRKGSFRLFCELANKEYEKSIPKGGAVELLGRDLHDGGSYTRAYFSMEEIRKACERIGEIKPDFVEQHFSESTFFSMIRRDIREIKDGELNKEFRFSHKSFCEYMVGYNLAHSIFVEVPEDAICGFEWNFYQTHEVSSHFLDEIVRIHGVEGFNKGIYKTHVQKAFEKELLLEHDLRSYSERLEQVLYYTGKLKIESSQIFEFLERICSDPKRIHPIYYRTAHLSLSLGKSVDYCLKYIEYLIDSFNSDKKAFEWNTDIQINYYGKTNLHTIFQEDIDPFIKNDKKRGKLEGILPLEIFSYFTCIPFDATEIGHSKEYLRTIRRICVEHKHTRMTKIIDETLPILKSISRVN